MVGFALAGALVVAVGPATALASTRCRSCWAPRCSAGPTDGLGRRAEIAADSGARERPTSRPAGFWRQLHEGWAFLRRDPVLDRPHPDDRGDQPPGPRLGQRDDAGLGARHRLQRRPARHALRRVRRRVDGRRAGRRRLGRAHPPLPHLPPRLPPHRAAPVRGDGDRRTAVGGRRRLPRRRGRLGLPEPHPRRGVLRADPRAARGPGQLAVDVGLLRADAARRAARRRAHRRDRPLPGVPARRRRLLRRHHGAGRLPVVPRHGPAPRPGPRAGPRVRGRVGRRASADRKAAATASKRSLASGSPMVARTPSPAKGRTTTPAASQAAASSSARSPTPNQTKLPWASGTSTPGGAQTVEHPRALGDQARRPARAARPRRPARPRPRPGRPT